MALGRTFHVPEIFSTVSICHKLTRRAVSRVTLKWIIAITDNMVERMNRAIGKKVLENQREWDEHEGLFMMVYRLVTHRITQITTSKQIFGREIRQPWTSSMEALLRRNTLTKHAWRSRVRRLSMPLNL